MIQMSILVQQVSRPYCKDPGLIRVTTTQTRLTQCEASRMIGSSARKSRRPA